MIEQSIILRKTGVLQNGTKLFLKTVQNNEAENYSFLNLMSSSGMSVKENLPQFPTQFPNTSSSESESETEHSSLEKWGKHHKENEVRFSFPKKRKIKSLNDIHS